MLSMWPLAIMDKVKEIIPKITLHTFSIFSFDFRYKVMISGWNVELVTRLTREFVTGLDQGRVNTQRLAVSCIHIRTIQKQSCIMYTHTTPLCIIQTVSCIHVCTIQNNINISTPYVYTYVLFKNNLNILNPLFITEALPASDNLSLSRYLSFFSFR